MEAPIEACGYLAENDKVVSRIFRMKNVDASSEHFSFEPAEQFAVMRRMRAAGLRLSAVYHSHPASPARPSPEDIRLANDPSLSCVIVSLAEEPPVTKSFCIHKGQVTPETVTIVQD